MNKNVEFPIDFVISWVNNSDNNWKKKRDYYAHDLSKSNLAGNLDERFRDFGFLKYLFRSIDKFSPWVNHIFLITDDQIPEFLDVNNSKISIVDHSEFIPSKYLPTFNSSAIELYINRIPNLSEHFVYFNDDMLINKPVYPTDFFDKTGSPKDSIVSSMIQPTRNNSFEVNDIKIINTYFDKKKVIRNHSFLYFNLKYGFKNLCKAFLTIPFNKWSALKNSHLPYSLKKSEFGWLSIYAGEEVKITSQNKFRSINDINIWIIQDIRYCLGLFSPRSCREGKYYDFDSANDLLRSISHNKYKILVINDDSKNSKLNRYLISLKIIDVLMKKFDFKSQFEV